MSRARRYASYGGVAVSALVCVLGAAMFGCGSSGSGAENVGSGGGYDAGADGDADADTAEVGQPDAPEVEAGPVCVPDADGDGIPDAVEGAAQATDTDKDTVPDYLDDDSDGDGIPDAVEGDVENAGCRTPQDSDGDGTPDFQDEDSDNNGLPDALEVNPDGSPYDGQAGPADTDGDNYPDYADPDNDDDGLLDVTELQGGQPIDTDGDGMPDLDDIDSDDDTIADGYEGASDFDDDGLANFRDPDADDDGVPDICEAGPGHDVANAPLDTDTDGRYDFIDLDTDADGLRDADEDVNGNCVVDILDGETDRRHPDSDSDGVSDLIEKTLGSDPQDLFSTPESIGQFFFVLPHGEQAQPPERVLPVALGLQRVDVGVVIDTTGTMGGEINDLRTGIGSVLTSLGGEIPDVGTGIAGHDDYPLDPYGVAGQDQPFYLPTPGAQVSTTPSDTAGALAALTTHNGTDAAESQVPAMWRGLTNGWLQWPGSLLGPDAIAPGRFGALAFRENALPIVVEITDAPFHNGRRVDSPTVLHDPYGFNGVPPYPAPTIDDLVDEMNAVGAKFIGIASNDGVRSGDPYLDMAYLAEQTGSMVPPSAFGGSTCNTGLGGNALPQPDGSNGMCRLVFDIREDGIGLSARLADAVTALVRSLEYDVRVVAISDAPSAENGWIESVEQFVEYVEVSVSGGDDPTDPAQSCAVLPISRVKDWWQGPQGLTPGGDTYWDTVQDVSASIKICYNLKVIPNTAILPKDDIQVFHAILQVRAQSATSPFELDFGPPRDVLFLIPATPQ